MPPPTLLQEPGGRGALLKRSGQSQQKPRRLCQRSLQQGLARLQVVLSSTQGVPRQGAGPLSLLRVVPARQRLTGTGGQG